MKKFFALMAVVLLSATSMKAQTNEKGLSWAVETGIGTEFEIGARAQYAFNKYLTWDVLHAKYAFDYNKGENWHEITLTTGLRGYSPSFGPSLKAFCAVDLGYGALIWDGQNTSCFAVDVTAGLQVTKHLYVGYGFGLLKHSPISEKDHLLRIGYNF